jgi:hypothetical protein
MNAYKTYSLPVIIFFMSLCSALAQATYSPIKLFFPKGEVRIISKSGTERLAMDRVEVVPGDEIRVATGGSVLIKFPNGSSSILGSNANPTSLVVTQYTEGPAPKPTAPDKEPGISVTKLFLGQGDIVSKVKSLNRDMGSKFEIKTPVGTAGVRGTTWKLTVIIPEDPSEPPIVEASTLEGEIVFNAEIIPEIPVPEAGANTATNTVGQTARETSSQEVSIRAGTSASVTQQTETTTQTTETTTTTTVTSEVNIAVQTVTTEQVQEVVQQVQDMAEEAGITQNIIEQARSSATETAQVVTTVEAQSTVQTTVDNQGNVEI